MTSRDGSDDFMPWWPMAMPSVTVMVQNSRGVPRAAATPFFTAWAWRISEMLQGAASFQQVATPTKGCAICCRVRSHRVEIRAMGRALRPLRHMTARKLRLVGHPRVHSRRLNTSVSAVVLTRPRLRNLRRDLPAAARRCNDDLRRRPTRGSPAAAPIRLSNRQGIKRFRRPPRCCSFMAGSRRTADGSAAPKRNIRGCVGAATM